MIFFGFSLGVSLSVCSETDASKGIPADNRLDSSLVSFHEIFFSLPVLVYAAARPFRGGRRSRLELVNIARRLDRRTNATTPLSSYNVLCKYPRRVAPSRSSLSYISLLRILRDVA